ncbi:ABC transporter ATP-binding protein [Lacticaseibacillus hulanensis]|uniref:ABC transporter ATP-binding protein n=1 Tax=Lacticaseibacillus hulanensis TaxID=2493111 RepID=UPI000FDAD4AD|nr:ABC transporter ATP-binding protein [Lacticaseibacillus hulanensis]
MATELKVKDLHKFFGRKQVLNGVDFTVETGHIAALVGPNGAGKSTIMKAILGLITTNGGEVTIAGHAVSITSHQELDNVGALIEYPGIYPFLTGRQHLDLFVTGTKAVKKAKIDWVVQAMQMGGYIDTKAKSYSLGMKQKLGIAQALLNRPKLVILDEPMNGLDPQAVKNLRDVIVSLAKGGTTFLISSHILSELEKLADTVLMLNGGRIVQQTTMHELQNAGTKVFTIHTVDDEGARAALINQGIQILPGNKTIAIALTEEDSLDKALRALINVNVTITGVNQVKHDLEGSFLDMIKSGEAK